MSKPLQTTLIAAVVVLLAACAVLFVQYRRAAGDFGVSRVEEARANARFSQAIDAIVEIQDSLNALSPRSASLPLVSGSLSAERRLSGPERNEVLAHIADLRAGIHRSQDRIRTLETNLHKNGIEVAGLRRMIESLKQSVVVKQDMIDSLHTQVTGLQTAVDQGRDTLRQRDEALEARREELATVYYVIGSKKQLTDSGIIVASGGVLGVGRTLLPSSRSNPGVFTPIDTDRDTIVRTGSVHARVLSAQSAASYELKLVEGRMELHILDTHEFRKIKQLVILTS
jgi:hypothetical protein